MEDSRVLSYKFSDDDTSDDSSSNSSSSDSSTVSNNQKVLKCNMNSEKAISAQDRITSVINRLKNNVRLSRKNSQSDEFSSRSRSSSDSNENEEREKSIPVECNKVMNYIEDANVEYYDGSSMLQFCQLGPTATGEEIAVWLRYNNFENFVDLFKGFNYYDLRRLNRNDFIEMCGTVKGIQIYNAIQMKPIRPLRTVYCALEPPNNNGINWQPVYLHCLSAIEINAEIVARFKLPTRKHSLWMEGPYGINILVNNEVVEYMEDNDMFLVRIVEYPSVEHYKIILKKYM